MLQLLSDPINAALFSVGILLAALSLVGFLRETHVRGWKHLDKWSIRIRVVIFILGVVVAVLGLVGSFQRKAHDEQTDATIEQLNQQIGTLQTGGVARDFSAAQIADLTAALRNFPAGFRVNFERCISDGSSLSLENDFAKAFSDAGVPIDAGVTVACAGGVVALYMPGDDATATFLRNAFSVSHVPVTVAPAKPGWPPPLKNEPVIWMNPKIASSP